MAATGDLLDLFRKEMNDKVAPFLWDDDFVYGALDDAQKTFCRKTDGIADSTTVAVCDLAVVPSTSVYTLSPTIIKIVGARRSDNGRPVKIVNEEDMPGLGMRFDGSLGLLQALIIGMDVNKARTWPVPNETVTVHLSVYRLPLADIIDDQALEIPLQHYRALLLRAKALAFGVQDAEAMDKTKAVTFDDKFEAYCATAKAEQARARHKPRSVAYGGI